MSQHRMFGEAMNQLHAPDDVYERVMERARGAKRKPSASAGAPRGHWRSWEPRRSLPLRASEELPTPW